MHKLRQLNFALISLILLLGIVGFAMLYSAGGGMDPWALKHIIRFAAFFVIAIIIAIIDLRIILKFSYLLYFLALILLIAVDITGHHAMGATRWFRIGDFNIQPSELMKIAIILALARYFHSLHIEEIGRIMRLIPPIIMVIMPVILILRQPNLGTSAIILLIAAMIFFASGVRMWKFAVTAGVAVLSIPLVWIFYMHDYQKKRVFTFLNPESDKLGAGYNILQSKIAIGSGSFSGMGFMEGSQNQLDFLPEKETDFIFTIFAEEFGFLGGVLLIFAFLMLILLCYQASFSCRNHFGKLIAIGVGSMIFWHFFINIAMVMGLIPVVGVPLPFLSYGGSIMLSVMVSVGLILNIYLHKNLAIARHGI